MLALEYGQAGPDEGWWEATNQEGPVHCTYISERATIGEQKNARIPVSEMPPLD